MWRKSEELNKRSGQEILESGGRKGRTFQAEEVYYAYIVKGAFNIHGSYPSLWSDEGLWIICRGKKKYLEL